MEKDVYLHSYEEAKKLAHKSREDPTIRAHLTRAFGGDVKRADAMLRGPSSSHSGYLTRNPEDEEFKHHFDRAYGQGAADSILKEHREWYGRATATPFDYFIPELADIRRVFTRGVARAGEEVATFGAEALGYDAPQIDHLSRHIPPPETTLGHIGEGLAQFAVPYAGLAKGAVNVSKLFNAGSKGKWVALAIAGAAADFMAFDPDEPQLVGHLIDFFGELGVEAPETFVDFILKDEDDSRWRKRTKQALEGAGLGVAAEGLLIGTVGIYRGFRRGHVSPEASAKELDETVSRVQIDEIDVSRVSEAEIDEAIRLSQERQSLREPQEPSRTPQEAPRSGESVSQVDTPREPPKSPWERPQALSEDDGSRLSGRVSTMDETASHVVDDVPPVNLREQEASVREAHRIAIAADRHMGTVYDDVLNTVLKSDGNILRDTGFRKHSDLVKAAGEHLSRINELLSSGDLRRLYRYAQEVTSFRDIKLRSAAFQATAHMAKSRRDIIFRAYEQAEASGSLRLAAALADELDAAQNTFLHVQSIDLDLGSVWGAGLQQRQLSAKNLTKMQKESEKSSRSAKRKAADAEAEIKAMEEEMAEVKKRQEGGSWVQREYNRVRKEGMDTVTAIRYLDDIIQQAQREGIDLNKALQPPKAPPKASDKIAADSRGKLEKVRDAATQFRFGAMLSGPKTHETNLMTSVARMASNLAYEGFYVAVTGNRELALMAGRRVAAMSSSFKVSLQEAIKAFK